MYEGPVQNLIDEFGKLPGIGPKSAQRLAFHLLQAEPEVVGRLQGALQAIRDGVSTFAPLVSHLIAELNQYSLP